MSRKPSDDPRENLRRLMAGEETGVEEPEGGITAYTDFNAPNRAAASAHRTAIDLVLAHLESAKDAWSVDTGWALKTAIGHITAMRDWTPEHAAEVLAESKRGKVQQ